MENYTDNQLNNMMLTAEYTIKEWTAILNTVRHGDKVANKYPDDDGEDFPYTVDAATEILSRYTAQYALAQAELAKRTAK